MARIFTDGAENTPKSPDWTPQGTIFTLDTNPVRSGVYSYYCQSNLFGARHYFTPTNEIYFRTAWYSGEYYDNSPTINFCNATTVLVSMRINTSLHKFRMMTGESTQVASGSLIYSLDTWYLLEFHIKIADSDGIIQTKVDGILDIDYTGDTKPSTQETIDNIYLRGQGSGGMNFDDIALNDTSGTSDNSWCGDGRIILLRPNGEGDTLQLTPSSGSTHYLMVDEVPFNTTDYVSGSEIDIYDLYNLANTSISASSIIARVWGVAYASGSVAEGGKISIGLKTGDSEYWSADATQLSSYTITSGSVYTLNPESGSAWSISDLDGLQVGVKIRGT